MLDATDKAARPAHGPSDHPAISAPKVGVLLANLDTPDHYSYWPMRRYLNEFLSDTRVIDYPKWKWQPLLQGIILTKRPFSSGANYKSIWNEELNESPLMTITKQQTAAIAAKVCDLAEGVVGGGFDVFARKLNTRTDRFRDTDADEVLTVTGR